MEDQNRGLIDLVSAIKFLLRKKNVIIKSVVVFSCIGLLIAIVSPVEYKSSCTVMVEAWNESGSSFGDLGSLAGLAGFDLNMGNRNSISPYVYPQIMSSIPFLQELLESPLHFSEIDTVVSSQEFFTGIRKPNFLESIVGYTLQMPFIIITWAKGLFYDKSPITGILDQQNEGSEILVISKDELLELVSFRERLKIEIYEDGTGLAVFSATMPDPMASSELTHLLYQNLTERITNYLIEQSQRELDFIEQRFVDAAANYKLKQLEVASYLDQNKFISSATQDVQLKLLENEVDIAYEVYKGLASQLEQAKIAVKKRTPVFTVVHPPVVPIRKESPKRILMIVIWMFSGFLFSIVLIGLKYFIRPIWQEIRS